MWSWIEELLGKHWCWHPWLKRVKWKFWWSWWQGCRVQLFVTARQYCHHHVSDRARGTLCGPPVVLLQQGVLGWYLESNDLLQMHNGTQTWPVNIWAFNFNRISTSSSNKCSFCTNTGGDIQPLACALPLIGKAKEEIQSQCGQICWLQWRRSKMWLR